MEVGTVLFGVADSRTGKMGSGYKYDPLVLQCALFPHLHSTSIVGPPRKRWKPSGVADKTDGDTNKTSAGAAVVLECTKQAFVVTCVGEEDGSRKYALSVLEPADEKEKKQSESIADADVGDDNTTTETRTATPPSAAAVKPTSPTSLTEKSTTLDAPENPPSSGTSTSNPTSGSETAEGCPPVSSPTPRPQQQPKPKPGVASSSNEATKPTVSLHALHSNLVETNFLFEKDAVIVKLPPKPKDKDKNNTTGDETIITADDNDDGGDDGELKIMVLRWRWFHE
ncbi:hypothetical protein M404DRAFT_995138 [Pisolithus tinctorius Marx 270]|uniref:Uncharacterized protein n=1 Tax=Pisolithus tinctorius Marx 270 TaxID=870435 RepID=A0A0C3PP22_PISTI|nr:hypothetical protein M404DRAFT_995138 [Pisolithus tinctorius Marx 270]